MAAFTNAQVAGAADRTRIDIPPPDLSQAELFLRALDPSPDAQFGFRAICERGHGGVNICGNLEQRVRQSRNLEKNGLTCMPAEFLTYLQHRGFGAFVMPNEIDGENQTKENVSRIRAFYLDCDTLNAVNRAREFIDITGLKPAAVVYSGGVVQTPDDQVDKQHVYFRVDNLPISFFSKVQCALIERTSSDPQVRDCTRVLRLPGYYHLKNAPRMTRIVEWDPARVYEPLDFVHRTLRAPIIAPLAPRASPGRKRRASPGGGGPDRDQVPSACTLRMRGHVKANGGLLTPSVRQLVTEAMPPTNTEPGNRHETAMAVVTRLAWEGWPDRDILDLLVPLADQTWGTVEAGSWMAHIEQMVAWVRGQHAASEVGR